MLYLLLFIIYSHCASWLYYDYTVLLFYIKKNTYLSQILSHPRGTSFLLKIKHKKRLMQLKYMYNYTDMLILYIK